MHAVVALAAADTVVVPGYLPLDPPGERVCSALRQAAGIDLCVQLVRADHGSEAAATVARLTTIVDAKAKK